jgi:hypothetical protein
MITTVFSLPRRRRMLQEEKVGLLVWVLVVERGWPRP